MSQGANLSAAKIGDLRPQTLGRHAACTRRPETP